MVWNSVIDGVAKAVMPAKAGIQRCCISLKLQDSRFHGNNPRSPFACFVNSSVILAYFAGVSEQGVRLAAA